MILNLKKKTAKEWSNLHAKYIGKDKLEPDDCNCNGCSGKGETFVGCLNCQIRSCCIENKYETCVEYEECEMINGLFSVPSREEAKNNLEKIRNRNKN